MWNSRALALECRDVLAAWVVCAAVAAGCFGLSPLAAALDGGGGAALINPAWTATVAAAGTDPSGELRACPTTNVVLPSTNRACRAGM